MRRLIVILLCLTASVAFLPGTARADDASSVPDAPTGVTATSVPACMNCGTHQGSATVSWVAPASNGSAIQSYTVTSTDPTIDPVTVEAPATSAVVPGLAGGTTYTFTVTATNAVGTSAPSEPVSVAVGSFIVDPVRPYLRVQALPTTAGHPARLRVRVGPSHLRGRLSFELTRVGGGFHENWSRRYAGERVYRSDRLPRPGRYRVTVMFTGHGGRWSFGAASRLQFRVARR